MALCGFPRPPLMVSQELRDLFVATLGTLGGAAGNGRLREHLQWEDDQYLAVHAALIQDGKITAGRGRGGSVSLSAARPAAPDQPDMPVNDLQLLPAVILDPPAVEMLFHESIAEDIEGAQKPAMWRSEASTRGRNATNVSGFVTQRHAWRHHRETNNRQFPPSKEADEAFMRAREPRR